MSKQWSFPRAGPATSLLARVRSAFVAKVGSVSSLVDCISTKMRRVSQSAPATSRVVDYTLRLRTLRNILEARVPLTLPLRQLYQPAKVCLS